MSAPGRARAVLARAHTPRALPAPAHPPRALPAGVPVAIARRVGLFLVGALLLAGCSGLPTGSNVQVERTVPALAAPLDAGVRVLPPGPADKATPADIVRGFLAAQADSSDGYAVARSFLAPAGHWRAQGSLTVYSTADVGPPLDTTVPVPPKASPTVSPVVPPDGTYRQISARLALVGALDDRGSYRPLDGRRTADFQLRVVADQWRITQAPDGLLLTTRDLQRSYQPVQLWWQGLPNGVLVPELRWLASPGAGLATALVTGLLLGPSPALSPGVRTAVPAGTTLQGSATLEGTDVLVDLSREAATVLGARADTLFQQLALTLSQVPTATGVRLTVAGQPLPLPGVPQRVDFNIAASVNPDTSVAAASAAALVGGRLVRLDANPGRDRQPGPPGSGLSGGDLHDPAISLDGTKAAALRSTSSGQQVVLASGSHAPVVLTPAGPYVSLSWDLAGELALGSPTGLQLRESDGRLLTVTVDRPSLAGAPASGLPGPIQQVRLARDGVRVALVAGPPGAGHLLLGVLDRRSGSVHLTQLQDLTPSLRDVTDVAWASSTQLVALGRDGVDTPVALWQLAADGSQLSTTDLRPTVPGTPDGLAAASGSPVLVSSGGVVYEQVGGGWRRVGPGTFPAYPG